MTGKTKNNNNADIAGVGIGLRHKHFKQILEEKPEIPWLEVHSENYFSTGSSASLYLEEIAKDYPISAHCIGLSLGSYRKTDPEHLRKLKTFLDRIQPKLFSDHLSWSATSDTQLPDLLPIPYTEEALDKICENVDIVQEYTGRQLLIENPSSYLGFKDCPIPENEFLVEAAKRTGAGILLDINNIYVSAFNHDFDGEEYLKSIPLSLIGEIHLAGYSVCEVDGKTVYIDTHGAKVFNPVWDLYQKAIENFGPIPTLIEWDTDIPELSVLLDEKSQAEQIIADILKEAA